MSGQVFPRQFDPAMFDSCAKRVAQTGSVTKIVMPFDFHSQLSLENLSVEFFEQNSYNR